MNLRHSGAAVGLSGFVAVGVLGCALALVGCKKKSQDGAEGTEAAGPVTTLSLSPVAAPTAVVGAPATGPVRKVGDRVSVRWKGSCYASKILSVAKPGVYFITYEGYAHSWDETIGESRICK